MQGASNQLKTNSCAPSRACKGQNAFSSKIATTSGIKNFCLPTSQCIQNCEVYKDSSIAMNSMECFQCMQGQFAVYIQKPDQSVASVCSSPRYIIPNCLTYERLPDTSLRCVRCAVANNQPTFPVSLINGQSLCVPQNQLVARCARYYVDFSGYIRCQMCDTQNYVPIDLIDRSVCVSLEYAVQGCQQYAVSGDSFVCQICDQNNYKRDPAQNVKSPGGVCVPKNVKDDIVDGCDQFENEKCVRCKTGFGKNGEGVCVKISAGALNEHCSELTKDSALCTSCVKDFFPIRWNGDSAPFQTCSNQPKLKFFEYLYSLPNKGDGDNAIGFLIKRAKESPDLKVDFNFEIQFGGTNLIMLAMKDGRDSIISALKEVMDTQNVSSNELFSSIVMDGDEGKLQKAISSGVLSNDKSTWIRSILDVRGGKNIAKLVKVAVESGAEVLPENIMKTVSNCLPDAADTLNVLLPKLKDKLSDDFSDKITPILINSSVDGIPTCDGNIRVQMAVSLMKSKKFTISKKRIYVVNQRENNQDIGSISNPDILVRRVFIQFTHCFWEGKAPWCAKDAGNGCTGTALILMALHDHDCSSGQKALCCVPGMEPTIGTNVFDYKTGQLSSLPD
ncbi:hypothetical protein O9G_005456 [Rozella allomycis CSF55]|uniref:Uncharacterized protein n=1 Tax=Rozella allomycis (strain CSF55) TaxID=988480 RepID=A0A075B0A1_ROZAC|nr:hypothetical protein O9G_005456 [Rozella allomycis CSF55]|eukprot:EPZ35950.1 hypothetical protein O9G_005456 [Rozella allomycis CSF55]